MSDDNAQGTPAPQAPAQPPVVANAEAPKAKVLAGDLPEEALKDRLDRAKEQARKALMAELGITDPEKAKAAIAAAEKAEAESRSISDRLTETSTKLGQVQTEADRLRAITAEFAERQMIGLSQEQQDAVKAIAGDDPAAQLRAITALSPTWAKAAAGAPKAVTPPTGTAPQHSAPESTSVSLPDHRAVYAALNKTNPFAAAQYALEHVRDVFPDAQ